jgi:hypothetical protein
MKSKDVSFNGSLQRPTLRLLFDPFQRVGLFLKSEDRIDFTAAPKNTNRMSLPDGALPNHDIPA